MYAIVGVWKLGQAEGCKSPEEQKDRYKSMAEPRLRLIFAVDLERLRMPCSHALRQQACCWSCWQIETKRLMTVISV